MMVNVVFLFQQDVSVIVLLVWIVYGVLQPVGSSLFLVVLPGATSY